jgi:hypothetical protein
MHYHVLRLKAAVRLRYSYARWPKSSTGRARVHSTARSPEKEEDSVQELDHDGSNSGSWVAYSCSHYFWSLTSENQRRNAHATRDAVEPSPGSSDADSDASRPPRVSLLLFSKPPLIMRPGVEPERPRPSRSSVVTALADGLATDEQDFRDPARLATGISAAARGKQPASQRSLGSGVEADGLSMDEQDFLDPARLTTEIAVAPSQRSLSFAVPEVDVDLLPVHELGCDDPCRSTAHEALNPPVEEDLTVVHFGPWVPHGFPPLPYPRNSTMLYQNLVYTISHRSSSCPPLQSLVAYHSHFATSMRSCRSFNLLISLALRHASFATVRDLLTQMKRERIKGNMATWKLGVRWLVLAGKWQVGWAQVERALERDRSDDPADKKRTKMNDIPWPVWLEFLEIPKRGALRTRGWDTDGLRPMRPLKHAGVQREVAMARYRTVMDHFPDLTTSVSGRESPRMVYLLVRMLLFTGQRELAKKMTKSYLHGLPPSLESYDRRVRKSLDLIHLHLAFRTPKWGVNAHYTAQETLKEYLALHPALRPNSTTTMLVLAALKRAMMCATYGWKFVKRFRRRWGARVVDSRVRRRIVSFALKEGRSKILKEAESMEGVSRWARQMWMAQRGVLGGPERHMKKHRNWLLPAGRKVFSGKGREVFRWKSLRWRVTRARLRH